MWSEIVATLVDCVFAQPLETTRAVLGAVVGASWAFGALVGSLGSSWIPLWPSWGHLGGILGRVGSS
eukprot:2774911-Pyramimonas_sp.AAC.1